MNTKFSDEQMERIVAALGGTLPVEQPTFYRLDFSYKGYKFYMKREKDKLEIHVMLPDYNNKAYNSKARERWDVLTTSIGVSKTKTDQQIVTDINRRFDFAELDIAKEMYAQSDRDYIDLIARHNALCDQVGAALGCKPHTKNEQRTTFLGPKGTYGDIAVNLLSVDFEVKGIDSRDNMPMLLKLCAAVKEHQKP